MIFLLIIFILQDWGNAYPHLFLLPNTAFNYYFLNMYHLAPTPKTTRIEVQSARYLELEPLPAHVATK